MVHDLAEYEKAADECRLTEAQLDRALFGPGASLFGHVAQGEDGTLLGFVLWFLNFSTWEGVHGIYVEDLYVRPEQRGSGIARRFWTALARECRDRGYARIEGWTLDWNVGTIAFHQATGAVPMSDWTVYRWTGAALDRLADLPDPH
jgi:GNAT superfamily N-acetyltransferase